MREKLELLLHCITLLLKLIRPGGYKAIIAENLALTQQLITLKRTRERSPALTTFDRTLFGVLTYYISPSRINKITVALKPATLLKFHKALVKRKYQLLFSNKNKQKPGRKSLDQNLINLIIEFRRRNPNFGYGRISMQIYQAFGITISRFTVGRILRKHRRLIPGGNGPSWLTFLGQMNNSLWSVDLFRCESITLKPHWVMVIIDQFSRRIIGFAVNTGDCDGIAYCRMFNHIISGKPLPKYLSADNDPIYLYHRWQANLRILEIEEIKSIPGVPTSHPFIERVIGTCRREFLDQTLFWNSLDLQQKLNRFKNYSNQTRGHSSLASKTPIQMEKATFSTKKSIQLENYRWKKHCNGLFQLPVVA